MTPTYPFVGFRIPRDATDERIAELYRLAALDVRKPLTLTLPNGSYRIASLRQFPPHDVRINEITWAVKYE